MNLARFCLLAVILWWGAFPSQAPAQDEVSFPSLPRSHFRSGQDILAAFSPVSAAATNSIVEVNVDGDTVALGTVVDAGGLVLTKASEIKPGKLTCWLPNGREVTAAQIGLDEDEDVALLRVPAEGLKPIRWAAGKVILGQWAITPALAETPQAVGIISATPRRLRPKQRALIGVIWDPSESAPKVQKVLADFGAEQAGIEPGDLIRSVNNELVTTRYRVTEIIGGLDAGQTVRLRLERDGRLFDAEVKLRAPTWEEFSLRRNNQMAGETSRRAEGFDEVIEHDTVIPPWLCGGPLMNLDGEAVGINIARASRVATYALPADLVRRILTTLNSASPSPRP